jgi:hypothetical protein
MALASGWSGPIRWWFAAAVRAVLLGQSCCGARKCKQRAADMASPSCISPRGPSSIGKALRATSLWPPSGAPIGKSPNNDSLVMRFSDGRVHFLLTDDIEKQAEEELVAEREPLEADFLKVPHHGSKTSSTEGFLAAVAPRVAVVSVGESNPGSRDCRALSGRWHPSARHRPRRRLYRAYRQADLLGARLRRAIRQDT